MGILKTKRIWSIADSLVILFKGPFVIFFWHFHGPVICSFIIKTYQTHFSNDKSSPCTETPGSAHIIGIGTNGAAGIFFQIQKFSRHVFLPFVGQWRPGRSGDTCPKPPVEARQVYRYGYDPQVHIETNSGSGLIVSVGKTWIPCLECFRILRCLYEFLICFVVDASEIQAVTEKNPVVDVGSHIQGVLTHTAYGFSGKTLVEGAPHNNFFSIEIFRSSNVLILCSRECVQKIGVPGKNWSPGCSWIVIRIVVVTMLQIRREDTVGHGGNRGEPAGFRIITANGGARCEILNFIVTGRERKGYQPRVVWGIPRSGVSKVGYTRTGVTVIGPLGKVIHFWKLCNQRRGNGNFRIGIHGRSGRIQGYGTKITTKCRYGIAQCKRTGGTLVINLGIAQGIPGILSCKGKGKHKSDQK